jgi:gliding motility-associated-like protein
MPTEARTTYYAAVTDDNDCTQVDSTTVIVFSKDVGLEDTLITVCFGEMKALNPNGKPEYEYQWSPADGLDDPTSHNPIFSGTMDQTYKVDIMDVDGKCMVSREVSVRVVQDVGLEVQGDTLICVMETIALTATAPDDAVIEWYADASQTDLIGEGSSVMVTPQEARTTYYVRAFNDTGCFEEDSVQVIVFEKDVALQDTTIIVCADEPTPLNPGTKGIYLYEWEPATSLDDPNSSNPTFTGSQDETYTVTVTDSNGVCMLTRTIEVQVLPKPAITLTNDTLICTMEPILLSATSDDDLTFEWYADPGLSQEIGRGSFISLIPQEKTNVYYVRGVPADDQCIVVDSVRVDVFDKNIGLGDTLITSCSTAPIELNPGGDPDYLYTWEPATGLDDPNSHNPTATLEESQSYGVTVTDVDGLCRVEKTVRVELLTVIGLTAPNDTLICEAGDLELTATTETEATISWYSDAQLTDLLSTGGTFKATPDMDSTIYYVEAVNAEGCREMDSVMVEIFEFKTGLKDTIEICPGTPTELNPEGNPAFTYTWEPNTGLSLEDPSNPVATLDAPTTYQVTVSNEICSITRTVLVDLLPGTGLVAQNDTTICEVEEIEISATATNAATLQWYSDPDLTDLLGEGPTVSVTPNQDTARYYVLATSDVGCTEIDTVNVVVFNLNTGIDPDGTSVCRGILTGINPEGKPAYTYQWSPAEGLDLTDPHNPKVSLIDPTTYEVTVTDPVSGCVFEGSLFVDVLPIPDVNTSGDQLVCEVGNVQIEAFGAATIEQFNWYDAPELDSVIGTGEILDVLADFPQRTFYIEAIDQNGCSNLDSAVIEVFEEQVEVAADTVYTICSGSPTEIDPILSAPEDVTYSWTPATGLSAADVRNPEITLTESQTYELVISKEECFLIYTIEVNVAPPINYTATQDTITCDTLPIDLEVSVVGEGIFIEWSDDSAFGNILADTAVLSVIPEGERLYYVRLTDENSCAVVDSISVIGGAISATIIEGDTLTSCEPGSELMLSVQNNIPAQELMYEWFPLDVVVGDPFGSSVTVNPTEETLVNVEVSNQYNCVQVLSTLVEVVDLTNLGISADPDTIKQGESSQLEVTGCEDCTYTWSPAGSLDDPNIANPVATPEETTTYTVKVRKGECEEELSITVTVMPPNCDPDYFIPDAFTPNDDGVNDVFRVRSENYELIRMIVYNRFGQEIFVSRNIDNGWDGTFNGRELGPDVFAWYVELRCIEDTQVLRQCSYKQIFRNVTLLR